MPKGLGVAARMGVELVVATCVGGGAGYFADERLDTAPWLMLLGVLIGTAAGVRNMLRIATQLEAGPDMTGGQGKGEGGGPEGGPADRDRDET